MEINGKITDIIFQSEETGYAVIEIDYDGEPVNATGTMPEPKLGYKYNFYGEYKFHNKYGEQFSFFDYDESLPENKVDIIDFLASGIIKGIGEKTALAIVELFGDDTLKILDEDIEKLKLVSGIGEKKFKVISESYREEREFTFVARAAKEWDIPKNQLYKLYKIFGKEVIEIVEENPYLISEYVIGFGFLKADSIGRKIGFSLTEEKRIKGGIKYILRQEILKGSTFLPKELLIDRASLLLEISKEELEDSIINIAFGGDIVISEILGEEVIYMPSLYAKEKSIAYKLMALEKGEKKDILEDIDSNIEMIKREKNINFSKEQIDAVKNSLDSQVSIITGGPGTGKTTIINLLIKLLELDGQKVLLAAPTGRAAKRMSEATKKDSSTIHRMLEYAYSGDLEEMFFFKNQDDPLDADVIIIDEASMIDIYLMKALLDGIKLGTKVIFSGDVDQLPSVGPGAVLKDMIDSEKIPVSKLEEIFRQAKESNIILNAHRINKGEDILQNEREKDFFLMERNTEKEILDLTLDLVKNRLPSFFDIKNPKTYIQVLTPLKKGIIGNINLNKNLQEILNPISQENVDERKEVTFGNTKFRLGDKVIQKKNNYQIEWKNAKDFDEGKGVFNGDIGKIEYINLEERNLTVLFDNERLVTYDFKELDQIDLAYSLTIHKSQGSEFPIVIIPISKVPDLLGTRNLLYTAVTRGKKLVILIGNRYEIKKIISNNRDIERFSGLKYRIIEQFDDFEGIK